MRSLMLLLVTGVPRLPCCQVLDAGGIREKKLAAPTGLCWWPCCFSIRQCRTRPVALGDARGVTGSTSTSKRKHRHERPWLGKRLTSWPLVFSISLWPTMTDIRPHPGPAVGELIRLAPKYNGHESGAVFKLGQAGLVYYRDA